MRAVMCGTLMLALLGCEVKNNAPPNVQLVAVQPEPTPEPNPGAPKVDAPKTMLKLDFAELWAKSGPPQLSPEEQLDRHFGLVTYSVRSEEPFAAELVGTGGVNSVLLVVRMRVQPEVVKRAKVAAEEKLDLKSVGGLRGRAGTTGTVGGRITTTISVVEPPAEAQARFREFVRQIAPNAMAGITGGEPVPEPLPGATLAWRIPYSLPNRTGTVTLVLLLPNASEKTLDAILPANDGISRALLIGRKVTDSLLLIIVDEK